MNDQVMKRPGGNLSAYALLSERSQAEKGTYCMMLTPKRHSGKCNPLEAATSPVVAKSEGEGREEEVEHRGLGGQRTTLYNNTRMDT